MQVTIFLNDAITVDYVSMTGSTYTKDPKYNEVPLTYNIFVF